VTNFGLGVQWIYWMILFYRYRPSVASLIFCVVHMVFSISLHSLQLIIFHIFHISQCAKIEFSIIRKKTNNAPLWMDIIGFLLATKSCRCYGVMGSTLADFRIRRSCMGWNPSTAYFHIIMRQPIANWNSWRNAYWNRFSSLPAVVHSACYSPRQANRVAAY